MPAIPISSPCQLTSAFVKNTATGAERTMMDEIELQLCLSIDSTPIPTPTKESQKQKEKQKLSSPHVQSHQLQLLGAKRLAEKMGYDDDNNEEEGEGSLNLDISIKSKYGDGDGDNHPRYLQLPPRKKARISFACDSEPTCPAVSGGTTSADSDMDKDKDEEPSHTTQTTDACDHIPSPFPLEHPQPPFPEESGTYLPALLDSLQLLNHLHPHPQPPDSTRRSQRFEIYEDPDDMDIDGVGYFNVDINTAWYLSPDDNKENTEEDGNGNHQHRRGNLSQHHNQSHRDDT